MKVWLTFKELQEKLKIKLRTLGYRLAKFKKEHPDQYRKITKKKGRYNLYKTPEIIAGISEKKEVLTNQTVKRLELKAIVKLEEMGHAEPDIINILDEDDTKQFMAIKDNKEREKVRLSISILYDFGDKFLTIEEACLKHNITARTFRNWRKEFPLISHLYYRAETRKKTNFEIEIDKKADRSMMKLVTGYEYEEIATTYLVNIRAGGEEQLIPIEKKITQKQVIPNPQMIQYVKGNTSNWRPPAFTDRSVDSTPDWEKKINAMSMDELVEYEKKLIKKNAELEASQ